MTHPDEYRSQDYIDNREANRELFIELMIDIAPTLSDKQKRKMLKEIDGLIEDLDDLMAD